LNYQLKLSRFWQTLEQRYTIQRLRRARCIGNCFKPYLPLVLVQNTCSHFPAGSVDKQKFIARFHSKHRHDVFCFFAVKDNFRSDGQFFISKKSSHKPIQLSPFYIRTFAALLHLYQVLFTIFSPQALHASLRRCIFRQLQDRSPSGHQAPHPACPQLFRRQ